MASTAKTTKRPLSPHLQIYSPLINMVMSIVHRMTGAALYAGTVLLAWWLIAAAIGPEAYATVTGFMGSWFGRVILLGYCWALLHHMFGGIRHFIWDTGRGLDLETVDRLAWGKLFASVAATVLICLTAFGAGAVQ